MPNTEEQDTGLDQNWKSGESRAHSHPRVGRQRPLIQLPSAERARKERPGLRTGHAGPPRRQKPREWGCLMPFSKGRPAGLGDPGFLH